MGRILLPSRGRMRLLISLIVLIVSLGSSGCGPLRVRADFVGYEKSYAETSNREVLLNLARLHQHDPTYFFKLGQISSSYRMAASLTATGNLTQISSPPATAIPTGGGTPYAIYENDPSFSFIPVNDDTNAKLLLTPVQEEVFYDLYYQGWRVDQLFRLMVDRIELTLPTDSTGTTCKVKIIRNVPPPVFKYVDDKGQKHAEIDYEHEQAAVADYATFLRVSAVVYALQKYGLLQLRGSTSFTPLDSNSWLSAESAKPPAGNPADTGNKTVQVPGDHTVVVMMPAEKQSTGAPNAGPTAKEFDEMAAKDQMWELQDGKWYLGRKVHNTLFQLTSSRSDQGQSAETTFGSNVSDIEKQLREKIFVQDESLHGLENAAELTDILEILYSGFAIEGSSAGPDEGTGFCPKDWSHGAPSRLVLRSLIGLMASAAQEQDAFDQLKVDNVQMPLLPGSSLYSMTTDIHQGLMEMSRLKLKGTGTETIDDKAYMDRAQAVVQNSVNSPVRFNTMVPTIERLPVLRLDWSHPEGSHYPRPAPFTISPSELGLQVNYKNQEYVVADADLSNVDVKDYARENQVWNRDMFRLINHLSSQVTVDISKFPLPEILQLRTE